MHVFYIPAGVRWGWKMSGEQSGPVGFSFSETMRGYIAAGEHEYHEAEQIGRKLGDEIAFHVTITMDDLDAFLNNPDHPARLTGTIESDRLGGTVPVRSEERR